jgi:serine/threonine protein kinase
VLVSNSDKLYVLKSIAKAIVELHNLNIVHGDLKPANILLTTHSPPEIKLCDFGLSFCDEQLRSGASLSNSSLFLTATSRGTPIYKAPEMIVNPLNAEFSELVARASKKTDIYSFAVLSWELLTLSKPFAECKTEVVLSTRVHQGLRPNMNSIPLQFHRSVAVMIESCWSADRKVRKSATECFSILDHNYQIINHKHFDIFLSHTWSSKPFLSHVYAYLSRHGYRVWYDQNEMRHDMIDSMNEGIENSKYFMACVSQAYQKSKNCMFEFTKAVDTKPDKILFLSLEADAESWATGGIQSARRNTNFFDFSDVANANWEDEDGPDEALLNRVHASLDKVMVRLGKVLLVSASS